MIVNYYTPPFRRVDPLDFPRLDNNASQERQQFLYLQLNSWSFCPHDLSDDDLLRCVEIIFTKVMAMDGLEMIHATQDTLHRFILAIRSSYHATNPYHDFYHAVDVLQATFYILNALGIIPGDKSKSTQLGEAGQRRRTALQRVFRSKDVFALMVASLGHDVGHPGVNNFYMINARTPLAELYNDQSVLENYHATSLFLLMRKHGLNFYDNDQGPVFKDFRSSVVNAILATDMGTHFDYVRQIHEQSDRIEQLADVNTTVTDTDRRLLTAAIIKCADICNATRPFKIARQWCHELLREFSMQSELEKKMGVPVSMPVDDSPVAQAKSQIDFISALAMPLFAAVSQVFPELQYTVDQLSANKTTWEGIRAAELAAQTTKTIATTAAAASASCTSLATSRRANERLLGEDATAHARRLSLPYPGLKRTRAVPTRNCPLNLKWHVLVVHCQETVPYARAMALHRCPHHLPMLHVVYQVVLASVVNDDIRMP
ncbi:hypothetical protein BDF19DRAFT_382090 [Syncephalis fuscata]|nr:hypothetical protein BDF19DRAFT_382090 [Syncephalis fuscata]